MLTLVSHLIQHIHTANGDFLDATETDSGTFVVRSIYHGKHRPLSKGQVSSMIKNDLLFHFCCCMSILTEPFYLIEHCIVEYVYKYILDYIYICIYV